MFTQDMTTNTYEVVSIGRNHYVVHSISREFQFGGVAFTSKRTAQAKCDEKNQRRG